MSWTVGEKSLVPAAELTRGVGVERIDAVESRSDKELLADHLAGKPGAFDALAVRYAQELYGFLFRFLGNAAAAEDLTQETFLQVHLAAQSFDATRAFKPWLYTIAANKARDYLRSRSRRQEQSLDAGVDDDETASPLHMLEAADAPVTDEVDAEERRALVRTLIEKMPEHLRLILMLGYFQQLPYAEIAEVLDIPVGTVKSRLHAAVTHFAKLWGKRGQGTEGARGRGNEISPSPQSLGPLAPQPLGPANKEE